MKILFTGGSSKIGAKVLENLLSFDEITEVWCTVHKTQICLSHPKIKLVQADLSGSFDLKAIPSTLDLLIHFAGVTHSHVAKKYWDINHKATLNLVKKVRDLGCRQMVYISTQCAVENAGAYGESKLAAEKEIQKETWDRLLIVRPAEVYGSGGAEGVDQFIQLAKKMHVVPLLFGDKNIRFSPIHLDDFIKILVAEIIEPEFKKGQILMLKQPNNTLELRGPEFLTGSQLALRIAKKHLAIPIPVYWPLLIIGAQIFRFFGKNLFTTDQISRLLCQKTGAKNESLALLQARKFLKN
jgi:nucleoside-diphosphate-sugar epimerase